ncbi:MAG: hypothetical protein H6R19_3403 [Proteobacteria bacterium]|nr:hypothetical protein [Pseudomonadota bacterium]
MSSTQQEDGFEFIRKMWGNMGFGLPGMVSPTLDVDELERRIKDLQAVEGWLKMNLGMLQMTIQGLEVQRSTIAAMQAMSKHGPDGESGSPFANPALWAWAFGNNETPQPAPDTAPPAPATAAPDAETANKKPRPKAAPRKP